MTGGKRQELASDDQRILARELAAELHCCGWDNGPKAIDLLDAMACGQLMLVRGSACADAYAAEFCADGEAVAESTQVEPN
jgi:hypothetical protein